MGEVRPGDGQGTVRAHRAVRRRIGGERACEDSFEIKKCVLRAFHPCVGRTVTRPISKRDCLYIDQGDRGPIASDGDGRHPTHPIGDTSILGGNQPKHGGVRAIAAINGQRGRLAIGLGGGVVAKHIIPRPSHQGDRVDTINKFQPRRLYVVTRNRVIAIAAINRDMSDVFIIRGDGVVANGIITRPTIKRDVSAKFIRRDAVVANGIITHPAIKRDVEEIISDEGVVADGVIARTAIQIDVGETVACLSSKCVIGDRIGEGGAGERGVRTITTLTLGGI